MLRKFIVTKVMLTLVLASLLSLTVNCPAIADGNAEQLSCDIDENGKINIIDIALIAKAFDSSFGDFRYMPEYDLNSDGSIDIVDLTIVAKDFGKAVRISYKGQIFRFQLPAVTFEINSSQYELPLNLGQVGGFNELKNWLGITQEQETFLGQNGFVVARCNGFKSLSEFYVTAKEFGMPILVTTDAVLNAYHVLFDETLKRVELAEFTHEVNSTIGTLLEEAQKQAEAYADTALEKASQLSLMYLEVAHALMQHSFTPETEEAAAELQLISDHSQITYSPIFQYKEDYSQYVPRGHYTENEQLAMYFRTMMWLGRMRFALLTNGAVNVEQTRAAILLTMILCNNPDIYNSWRRIYEVTKFYVGESDDLTFEDYLTVLNEMGITSPEQVQDGNIVIGVAQELLQRNKAKILGTYAEVYPWLPQEDELERILSETAGLRFMGQRFIPDSYVFQQLVFPQVGNFSLPRRYPKSLDVAAVFGSDLAKEMLFETETVYQNYTVQLENLREQFDKLDVSNWTQNLYWTWLYTANTTLERIPIEKKYPTFMTKPAWGYQKLQTFLGTWTELRHDTLLYSKQSYTGFFTSVPPPSTAYVEPYPDTYNRLIGLINMTMNGLRRLKVLSSDVETSLASFMEISELFLSASILELEGKSLDSTMQDDIRKAAVQLSRILSVASEKTQGATLVADVHTDPNYPAGVLEEALGKFNALIIVYADGSGTLCAAAGPAYNYFEFIQPLSNRLTDEAWADMLSSNPPAPPEWTANFAK